MNIIKYCLKKSYRKHRWAARHLSDYRQIYLWLVFRRADRVQQKLWQRIHQRYILPCHTIVVPHIEAISTEEFIGVEL